jgi:hypothetical protein
VRALAAVLGAAGLAWALTLVRMRGMMVEPGAGEGGVCSSPASGPR